jgi:hypothetical protein
MLKTKTLKIALGALALASVSVPALAGSYASSLAAPLPRAGFEYVGGESGWEPAQHKYVWTNGRFEHSDECDHAVRAATSPASAEVEVVSGFEFVGGEGGWEPAQHKYVFVDGRLAHSDECDHVIRVVATPTRAEIDEMNALYPG